MLQLASRAPDEEQMRQHLVPCQQHQDWISEQSEEERQEEREREKTTQGICVDEALHSTLLRRAEQNNATLEVAVNTIESSCATSAMEVLVQELKAAQDLIAASENDEHGGRAYRTGLSTGNFSKHIQGARIIICMHVHLAMSNLQQRVSFLLGQVEELARQAQDHTRLSEFLARELAAAEQQRREMSAVTASLLHDLACARHTVGLMVGILQECRMDLDEYTSTYACEAQMQGAARFEHLKVLEQLEHVRESAFLTVSDCIAQSPLVEDVVNNNLEEGLMSPLSTSAEEALAYDTNCAVQVLARSVSALASRQQHQQMREENFDRALRCAYEWMSLEENHAQKLEAQLRATEAQRCHLQDTLSHTMRCSHVTSSIQNKCVTLLTTKMGRLHAYRSLQDWYRYVIWCKALRFVIRQARARVCVRILSEWKLESNLSRLSSISVTKWRHQMHFHHFRSWQQVRASRQRLSFAITRQLAGRKRSLLSNSFEGWSLETALIHQTLQHITKCLQTRACRFMSTVINAWKAASCSQHQTPTTFNLVYCSRQRFRILVCYLREWRKSATEAAVAKTALMLTMHAWRMKTLLVLHAFSSWWLWQQKQQTCCAAYDRLVEREMRKALLQWRQQQNKCVRFRLLLRKTFYHLTRRTFSVFVRRVLTKQRLCGLTTQRQRVMLLSHLKKWQRMARILAFVGSSCAQEESRRRYLRAQTFFAQWEEVRSRIFLAKRLNSQFAKNRCQSIMRRVVWEWMYVHIQRLKVRVSVAHRLQRHQDALDAARACYFLRWRVLVVQRPSTKLKKYLMRWVAFTSSVMHLRLKIRAWESRGRAREFNKRLNFRTIARSLSTWVLSVACSSLKERARSKRSIHQGLDKRGSKVSHTVDAGAGSPLALDDDEMWREATLAIEDEIRRMGENISSGLEESFLRAAPAPLSSGTLSINVSNVDCSSSSSSRISSAGHSQGFAECGLPPPPPLFPPSTASGDSPSKFQSLATVANLSCFIGHSDDREGGRGGAGERGGEEEGVGRVRRAGNISSLSSISSRPSIREEMFGDREQERPFLSLLCTGTEGMEVQKEDSWGQALARGTWERDTILYGDGALGEGGRQRPAEGEAMTTGSSTHSITHLYCAEEHSERVVCSEQGEAEHASRSLDDDGWVGGYDAGGEVEAVGQCDDVGFPESVACVGGADVAAM